ncbi:MAG: HEAT repeat domain-containing protein [Acidobacteria bacterium]|nr:HEAT repeat domain-containing protein [Acidobacteriota bacterium]MCZ6832707.1 HEAT repeat domain-containing protein [Acidobacteriota bacterium]
MNSALTKSILSPAGGSRRMVVGVTLALGLLLPGMPAAAPGSLYERLAYADLVVHVRTLDGTLRLAECQVKEVLKGSYEGDKLFVAFRSDNTQRENFRDRIVFMDEQESILLLTPVLDSLGHPRAPNRFRLVGKLAGKIDLPQEGAQATIDAVRRLSAIQNLTDIHQIWAAYRLLILETNPILVETGFSQILKFRLGNPEMVPTLLDFLDSRDDRFRRDALQVQTQIFRKSRRDQAPLGNEDHVVARLLTVAMEDPAPAVRVAAVQALNAYGRPDVLAALQQVARDDPSQFVRYEATVSVYRLRREEGSPQAPAP